MESVAFSFNGTDTLVATIYNAVIGTHYGMVCYSGDGGSTPADDTAVSDTLVLTISDISLDNSVPTFEADVYDVDTNDYYACTLYPTDGSTEEFAWDAVWTYDGDSTVTVTIPALVGGSYEMFSDGPAGADSTSPVVAQSQSQLFVFVMSTPPTGLISVSISRGPVYRPYGVRVFRAGQAGIGFAGNPRQQARYQRIYGWTVNISDDALETVDPVLVSPSSGATA